MFQIEEHWLCFSFHSCCLTCWVFPAFSVRISDSQLLQLFLWFFKYFLCPYSEHFWEVVMNGSNEQFSTLIFCFQQTSRSNVSIYFFCLKMLHLNHISWSKKGCKAVVSNMDARPSGFCEVVIIPSLVVGKFPKKEVKIYSACQLPQPWDCELCLR